MEKELRKTARQDRKERSETEAATHVRGVLTGDQSSRTVTGKHSECVSRWISIIREKYRGAVLRRTGLSKTNTGELISGLSPVSEHNITFPLYPQEGRWMETLAGQLSGQKAEAGMSESAGKVSHTISNSCASSVLARNFV